MSQNQTPLPSAVLPAPSAEASMHPNYLSLGGIVAFLGGLWLVLFYQLRIDWSVNPNYAHGWLVPVLCLGLLWRRWGTRPTAGSDLPQALFLAVFSGLLLVLLPLRVLEEANPEWRMMFWWHAGIALAITMLYFWQAGGRPWVAHFLFPLAFALNAVPWPMWLERLTIQTFMQFVAGVTVQVMDLWNIPTFQRGNLIETSIGLVGIDEACSGIRSFQSTILVSLFLGELYYLSRGRRCVLLLASIFFSLAANIGRTSYLVLVATQQGLARMQQVHDHAGNAVMLIVLPGLIILALLLRKQPPARISSPILPGARAIPPGVWVAGLVWIILVEVAAEGWYRVHEAGLTRNASWTFATPGDNAKPIAIDDRSLATIRCDDSQAYAWQDADANQWITYFFRWKPGRNSAQLAKGHTPDICLQGAGFKLLENSGPKWVELDGLRLPFNQYIFEAKGQSHYVFQCIWSDRSAREHESLLEDGSVTSRFQAARQGRRNLGQQVLEVVLLGPNSPEEALAVLTRGLRGLIVKPSSVTSERLGGAAELESGFK